MSSVRYILSDIDGFNDIINSNDNSIPNILNLNRTSNNTQYKVITYDKKYLNYDLISSYGLCRSIIVNNRNKVVSFAPPKSMPCDEFIQKYDETTYKIVAEEFIEGTMINVFWDETNGLSGDWEISTRNTVGATSSFYKGSGKTKTFREMFFEAAKENNLELNFLETNYCYSFVLQHPDNRIVVPFNKPLLYLVAVYSIHNEADKIIVENYNANQFQYFFNNILNSSIMFPQIYKFEKYSKLIETYASMNTPYNIVGAVVHNYSTGERMKIRNPVYEHVRNLRGNQPKLQYQYICLRKEGKVREFLEFYPENKKELSIFRDQIHLFTNTLFTNYVSCYIKKERQLINFSEQYKTHMFNIHQKYINELREKKQFVTNTVVINYVNGLHPSLLMYCLNFHMRKQNVDTIHV